MKDEQTQAIAAAEPQPQGGASIVQLMKAVAGILTAARESGLLTPDGVKKGASVAEWVTFASKAFTVMADAGLTLADVATLVKELGPIIGTFVK